jgi:beta-mannosidase
MRSLCFIILLLQTVFVASQKSVLQVDKWLFHEIGKKEWHEASVPGTIHTDLLQHKFIADPFFGTNEKLVQDIENKTWEYLGHVSMKTSYQNFENAELVCEGLDTYAEVYFNDTLLFRADNMFLTWRKDIKKLLKQNDSNYIRIIFLPSKLIAEKLMKQIPYTLPGGERVFTRKAQYQYGWDWGPRLVTAGIWKPSYLEFWSKARFESVRIKQTDVDTLVANATLECEIISSAPGNYKLGIVIEQTSPIQKNILLKKGLNHISIPFKVNKPKLWWCNGMGDPNLYTINVSLLTGSVLLDKKQFETGFRKIELIRKKDPAGESFYFKLNGKPVFIKGANFIPHDNFLTRQPNYNIPQTAAEMNMNMLRVWAGGAYADEKFYKACDRNGILIWQDFMFACAMYPGDSTFIKSVREEAKQQVQRISNHACLALWCGNNENDEGWKNWGWQKEFKYSKADSTKIWSDYQSLFHQVLPSIVKTYNSEIAYWPSSPSIGWGHKESLQQGDSHYWGVWWGNESFEVYEKKVGRFMSEYGFQGMPSVNTFKHVCDSSKLYLRSPDVNNHQKHPSGYKTIQTYLERDYKTPASFEKYIYVSQLLQAKGMRAAIEAHRRAKPYCMGTLYWQMNDCWPVTSWSAVDYYGRKKALYYETKRSYRDVMISVSKKENTYEIYVVSELAKTFDGDLTVSIKDFAGKILYAKNIPVKIDQDSAKIVFRLKEDELAAFQKNNICLNCVLTNSGQTSASLNYFFVPPKELNLIKPNITIEWNGTTSVTVSSQTFVKDLYLFTENEELNLSDNFLDIEPGKRIVLNLILPANNTGTIKFLSLYDINKPD